jgi:hypothetical protein
VPDYWPETASQWYCRITPDYQLLITGVSAQPLEQFTIRVGSQACGNYILTTQYVSGDILTLNRSCLVSHGG